MKVNKLVLKNYKNISSLEIEPTESVNIIYGENAQGKTNILEALWLFTGIRSFRGTKDGEQIKFSEKFAKNKIFFESLGREQSAEIIFEEKKSAFLNEIKQSSVSKFGKCFYAVIFSPEHLSLVKGGPNERRKFIDNALCQIKPSFGEFLSKYKKNLVQRNALLKDYKYNNNIEPMLDIFENNLAYLGSKIIIQRKKYIEVLNKETSIIYMGLSSGNEKMELSYLSENNFESDNEEELIKEFTKALKLSRNEDMYSYTTSVGPHRDDIDIKIKGISAKKFGSQGQQRSAVIALKLGEANVLKQKTGEQPIALLDDVMSELDEQRQDYILHHIDGWQVFVTCCEPNTILKLKGGKTFKVENGSVTEVKEK